MTWFVKIELPGLPPTPNSVMAMHWAKKSKLTKRWRRDAYLACKANGPAPLGTKVIRVCYTRFSSREPDPDGLAGSFKSIQDGVMPPTINLDNPDEGFDLNFVANEPQERPVKIALNNSFGFGGHNVSLAFAAFDG